MKVNYHTHLGRCMHAVGTEREYVESAIEAGFDVLGISDHVAWPFPGGYVSRVRMPMREMDSYVQTVLDLKKEYRNDIKLLLGFETEYMPAMFRELMETVDQYPLDYMIQGQHFLGVEYDSIYTGWKHPEEEVLKGYVDIAIEGIKSGRYLYMAHPDLVNFTGEEALYRQHMKRLCVALKEADIPVEINILGLWEGRQYPARRFLELAKEVGNKAIIGMDAHSPGQLLNREAVERAKVLCAEYNLPLVDGDLLDTV